MTLKITSRTLSRSGINSQVGTETVKVTVDGHEFAARKGEMLIKAAQDNGTYIPRFCWHPRMKPVGMCRMCLVEIETPRGKALITACTNAVADGMAVDTKSDVVKKAQEGVLEFLLINHPLDCPVCDRGGECPLQDHTLAYGPGESRFVEEKRHFEKPIPISKLVFLDRERCILCARCTRFSDEVSGDPLIEFLDRGNYTQVNTFPEEPFSSYFAGNTVQICPVGALTAKPYRFRARPWDLTAIDSTCPHCTAGDHITVQSSQNEILRFLGAESEAVNWGWLSDKCRFGFEYINSPDRVTTPLVRGQDGSMQEASWAEALDLVAARLGEIKQAGKQIAVLGGARGTNEDAYALSKFARVALGTNHVDCQMDDGLDPQFLAATADRALIADLDNAKTILIWGPDLKEEHPTLYLRARHSAQERGARLVIVHPRATGLDDWAAHKVSYRPGSGAEVLTRFRSEGDDLAAAVSDTPLVALVGRTGYGEDGRLAEAVAAFVRSKGGKVLPLARRSNVYGALDMGLAPNLAPGRISPDLSQRGGAGRPVAGKTPAGSSTGFRLATSSVSSSSAPIRFATSPTVSSPARRSSRPSSSWPWINSSPTRHVSPMWSCRSKVLPRKTAPSPTSKGGCKRSTGSPRDRASPAPTGRFLTTSPRGWARASDWPRPLPSPKRLRRRLPPMPGSLGTCWAR